jgi:hypothetical protein
LLSADINPIKAEPTRPGSCRGPTHPDEPACRSERRSGREDIIDEDSLWGDGSDETELGRHPGSPIPTGVRRPPDPGLQHRSHRNTGENAHTPSQLIGGIDTVMHPSQPGPWHRNQRTRVPWQLLSHDGRQRTGGCNNPVVFEQMDETARRALVAVAAEDGQTAAADRTDANQLFTAFPAERVPSPGGACETNRHESRLSTGGDKPQLRSWVTRFG